MAAPTPPPNGNNTGRLATPYTVSFQENVKGWVSFKSFIPENGISCANDYFTFQNGFLYRHHDESQLKKQNTFYDTFIKSRIDFIFNQIPGSIKSFETINYEGSQAKVFGRDALGALIPLSLRPTVNLDHYGMNSEMEHQYGWYVESLETEQEKGTLEEFVKKERKWFNHIRGVVLNVADDQSASGYDPRNFAHQGLGVVLSNPNAGTIYGCTDPYAWNYYAAAQVDDGSCIPYIYGCTNSSASNYNPLANTDDGSCYTLGCTDPYASNFNSSANTPCNSTFGTGNYNASLDNECCTYCNYGCTNSTMFNYDAAYTCDGFASGISGGNSCVDLSLSPDCDCIPIIYGCLDDTIYPTVTVTNLSATANVADNSCVYAGCSDPNAECTLTHQYPLVYDPNSGPLDWGVYDTGNIDPVTSAIIYATCGCWDTQTYPIANYQLLYDSYTAAMTSFSTIITGLWPIQPCPTNANDTTNCTYSLTGCMDPTGCAYSAANTNPGACLYCGEFDMFNYDGGTTLSGGICGPSTSTGSCLACPSVDNISLNVTNQYTSSIPGGGTSHSIDYEFVITDPEVPSHAGGYEKFLHIASGGPYGFVYRLYNITNLTAGQTAFVDADYESFDVSPSSGGSLQQINLVPGGGTFEFQSQFSNIAPVFDSRENGVINTTGGYGGNSTLSLLPGNTYQIAMMTLCENPVDTANAHLSNSDWEYNVGTFTVPHIDGCMDSTANNYNSNATGDPSLVCTYSGCMDPSANDGNLPITWNGNTYYPTSDCLGVLQTSGFGDTSCCDYSCIGLQGCTDATACNYDAAAVCDDGSCEWTSCITQVTGCTDPASFNYDPLANVDDGSCVPYVYGCLDPLAANSDCATAINPNSTTSCTDNVNTSDGTCVYEGCTDATADNYDANATIDDGSCIIGGCMDGSLLAFNNNFPTATNYNPNATYDDGSCIYVGCLDPIAGNYCPSCCCANYSWAVLCDYSNIVNGCTDPNASNYNSLANVDDGSCEYIGCTDPTAINYNANWTVDTVPSSCTYHVYGCTAPTASNYDPSATSDDGTCIPFVYGCMDVSAYNYNSSATSGNADPLNSPIYMGYDGNCCYVPGCTNPTAINYSSAACYDNGNCYFGVLGCTDPSASNYNSSATTDDGSCCKIPNFQSASNTNVVLGTSTNMVNGAIRNTATGTDSNGHPTVSFGQPQLNIQNFTYGNNYVMLNKYGTKQMTENFGGPLTDIVSYHTVQQPWVFSSWVSGGWNNIDSDGNWLGIRHSKNWMTAGYAGGYNSSGTNINASTLSFGHRNGVYIWKYTLLDQNGKPYCPSVEVVIKQYVALQHPTDGKWWFHQETSGHAHEKFNSQSDLVDFLESNFGNMHRGVHGPY